MGDTKDVNKKLLKAQENPLWISIFVEIDQQIFLWPVFPYAVSRRVVVGYWRIYVHFIPVNHLGGLRFSR